VAAGVLPGGGSPLAAMNDAASEAKLRMDLTTYGSDVQATDIRTQASLDTTKAGLQAAIFRANATVEQSMGHMAAASYRSGGVAANAGANAAADMSMLTGLGSVAYKGAQLFGGVNVGDIFGPGGIPSAGANAPSSVGGMPTSGFTGGGAGNMFPEFAPAAVSY
jgi:hypothetical protein